MKKSSAIAWATLLLTPVLSGVVMANTREFVSQRMCSFQSAVDGREITVYVEPIACTVTSVPNESLRLDWADGVVTEVKFIERNLLRGDRTRSGISVPQISPVDVTIFSTGEILIEFQTTGKAIWVSRM